MDLENERKEFVEVRQWRWWYEGNGEGCTV